MPVDWTGRYVLPKPGEAEIFCYCNNESYLPGDIVYFHISASTAYPKTCTMIIETESIDGFELKYSHADIPVQLQPVDEKAYEKGCHWPISHAFEIPSDWPSGFYIVTVATPEGADWETYFIVRPSDSEMRPRADLLLILSTNTWNAYNNWGGASAYEGLGKGEDWLFNPEVGRTLPLQDLMRGSPFLSIHRPLMRGVLSVPEGVPRMPHPLRGRPHAQSKSRQEFDDLRRDQYSAMGGRSPYALASGWAAYERHWVLWALRNGYTIDMVSNRDLHLYGESLLTPYRCVVCAGHDEYWSWEMRDAVDAYVAIGGNVARFAGNFTWQIRFEEDATRQVCYKYCAPQKDPVVGTDKQHLTTFSWESKLVNRPGCKTFGLNASRGIYARTMDNCPRHPGGFTVYRHKSWVFAGTELQYGDIFGSESIIFGFEVDGLAYVCWDGCPFPTGEDGAPVDGSIEILAMGLAHNEGLISEQRFVAVCRYGNESEQSMKKAAFGSGMLVEYKRGPGSGTVLHAGSCEWVAGLIDGQEDELTAMITKNILNKLLCSSVS